MPRAVSDAEFDAFVKDLFDWYTEWDPLTATSVGIHRYDHLLPKGTYDAVQEETSKDRSELDNALKSIDRRVLRFNKSILQWCSPK